MRNLIPHFIQEMTEQRKTNDHFYAATIFMDMSGFTKMTETLMSQGKEGAEVLSVILNNIFEPIIQAVYDRGGFVSVFAGDAMTIIFPEDKNRNVHKRALFTARFIRELFKEEGLQKTRLGEFSLSVKQGLSYGSVEWGIVGYKDRKTYFFRGDAVDGCAFSEHHCDKMDIVFDYFFNKLLTESDVDKEDMEPDSSNMKHYKVTSINFKGDESDIHTFADLKREVLSKFMSDAVINFDQVGEFRNIISLFISFQEPNGFKDLDRIVSTTLEKVELYGGYFNVLDFGDKGGTMLILFGAPISYEDNMSRAMKCIDDLRNELKHRIRAGVVSGIVYTGIVGTEKRCTYTALGDTVNMSARFMMKADWGEVWISEGVANNIKGSFEYTDGGKYEFKGKSEPIQIYKLDRRIKSTVQLFEGRMVGRKKEVVVLKSLVRPLFEESSDMRFAGIVYIYGEAGIGKSRIAYEFVNQLKPMVHEHYMQVDGILKQSLNPFVYYFENYFKVSEIDDSIEKKQVFELNYDKMLDQFRKSVPVKDRGLLERELIRIKSIIGSLLGIYWKGSVYESIDAKDLPEVLKFAVKDFFKAQSLIKPCILILDDMHWIDSDTEEVFQIFTREMKEYPMMILCLSRLRDDGSKPELDLDPNVITRQIELSNLPEDEAKVFIHIQLGKPVSEKLYKLINEKTINNPFFIEQLCLYMRENAVLVEHDGVYDLKDDSVNIPAEMNSVLVARIDRLSSELKEAVQMGSVLGREFDVKVIYEMLEVLVEIINILEQRKEDIHLLSTRIKADDIKVLLSEGEIEKVWTNFSEIRYIFKHALLMNVVYEMQLKQRVRELHNVAGEAIFNLYKDEKKRYSEIAYHYEEAERKEKAIEFYEKAGDYAKENFRNDKALEYYQKSLKFNIEENGEDNEDTAKLYNNMGDVHLNDGKFEEALNTYNKAYDILKDKLEEYSEPIANVYNNIGLVYLRTGAHDSALEYFDKTLQIRKKVCGENHEDTAISYTNVGTAYWEKGDYDKALEYYDMALEVNKEIHGDEHIETALTYNDISMIYWMKGENDTALDYLAKSEKLLLSIYDEKHLSLGIIYTNYGKVYWSKGDLQKSIENSRKAYKIRSAILGENHLDTLFPLSNIGMIYWMKGEYKEALKYLGKTLKILFEVLGEYHMHTSIILGNVALVYDALGKYKKAMSLLKQAYKITKTLVGEDHPYIALSYSNMGRVYSNTENFDEAIPLLEKSIAKRLETGDKNNIGYDYTYIAYDNALTGNCGKAFEYALKHFENIKEIGHDVEKGRSHLSVAVALSKCDTSDHSDILSAIKDITEGELTPEWFFEKAYETSSATNHRLTMVPALYKYAEYLISKGENREAGLKLEEAKRLAKETGLGGELEKLNEIKKLIQD